MTAREVDAVLTRAADTIEDPMYPYSFQNWNECAVGHIYAAVKGIEPGAIDGSDLLEAVSDPTAEGELMEALREIARRIPPAPYELSRSRAGGAHLRPLVRSRARRAGWCGQVAALTAREGDDGMSGFDFKAEAQKALIAWASLPEEQRDELTQRVAVTATSLATSLVALRVVRRALRDLGMSHEEARAVQRLLAWAPWFVASGVFTARLHVQRLAMLEDRVG